MNVVVCVKQVPRSEALALGPDGRLARDGVAVEMSAYCRRALAKGIELAKATDGRCVVVSLGPPAAAGMLREALACGADEAVLVSDPAFAGSDTLVTARALAAAIAAVLGAEGPLDLVLVGRASLDAETGQVGPQLAELLDLPFASAVRELELDLAHGTARVRCELDDGTADLTVAVPAVLAMAERSCSPARAQPGALEAVDPARVRRLRAADLASPGPWGADGSPTRVEAVEAVAPTRAGKVLTGEVGEQVDAALELLAARGALDPPGGSPASSPQAAPDHSARGGLAAGATWPAADLGDPGGRDRPGGAGGTAVAVAVLLEPDRARVAAELLGAAARLAPRLGGCVVAVGCGSQPAGSGSAEGADAVLELVGSAVAEDVAATLSSWVSEAQPAVVLAPATSWGREVAARLAARLGAGLVGDVVDLDVVDGRLRGIKPACAGGLLATVAVTSQVQLATVRPGALAVPPPRETSGAVPRQTRPSERRGRVTTESRWRDDGADALERASVVVGVGLGVSPDDYGAVRRLARRLGAEVGATRKVTDRGDLPRARQIGITGRNLAPRLYLALGVAGSPNHLSGVARAGTVVAVNLDPSAPALAASDIGMVADWRDVVAVLLDRLGEDGPAASR